MFNICSSTWKPNRSCKALDLNKQHNKQSQKKSKIETFCCSYFPTAVHIQMRKWPKILIKVLLVESVTIKILTLLNASQCVRTSKIGTRVVFCVIRRILVIWNLWKPLKMLFLLSLNFCLNFEQKFIFLLKFRLNVSLPTLKNKGLKFGFPFKNLATIFLYF